MPHCNIFNPMMEFATLLSAAADFRPWRSLIGKSETRGSSSPPLSSNI